MKKTKKQKKKKVKSKKKRKNLFFLDMCIRTTLLILAAILFILFIVKPTMTQDGSIMIFCRNSVNTRGGTICLDNAYRR